MVQMTLALCPLKTRNRKIRDDRYALLENVAVLAVYIVSQCNLDL